MPLDSGSKVALVHGFATDAAFSIFRPALGADAGFESFCTEVENGEVAVFRWGIERELTLLQMIGLLPVLRLYRDEERRAADIEWQEKLFAFIENNQIEIIVCHSLGSRFLLDMLNRFGAPSTVKRILFVQADIAHSHLITNEIVIARMREGALRLINAYCPWDQSLIASMILTGRSRYGLSKVDHPHIENVFLPLKTLPNLHTCSIRSERLKELI